MVRAALALPLLMLALAGCLRDEPLHESYVAPPLQPSTVFPPWPELADAEIRPGVQAIIPTPGGGSQCTTNFLFRSPDNRSLFIGVAAHCLGDPSEPAEKGTLVRLGSIQNAGTVYFNAWAEEARDDNDCGLIRISDVPSIRAAVHPAVLHFGGPASLADSEQAGTGDKVITYGSSDQRPPSDPDNPREGYVLQREGGMIEVVTDHPGIQGDSGSGLMTADGQALGVLSLGLRNPAAGTLENRAVPTVNWYVALDKCMVDMQRYDPTLEGLELVTWPQLEGPELPV